MATHYDLVLDGGVSPEVDNPTGIQAAMDAAAAAKLPLYVPPQRFYSSSQLLIRNNLHIIGAPTAAIWPVANIVLFKADTVDNWSIKGISSEGFCSPDYSTHYPTIPDNGQGFLREITCNRFEVSGIKLKRFAGTGIQHEGTYGWDMKGVFERIWMTEMFRGVKCHNIGEYTNFDRILISKSTFGIEVDSGNNIFTGCQVTHSGAAFKLTGGTNNAHGQCIGCTFNHNNWNLVAQDVTLGQTFSGCHFNGTIIDGWVTGRIGIYNSRGIHLIGGHLGSNVTVDGTGSISGQNTIQGMYVRTDHSDMVAPTITNGGLMKYLGNTTPSGMYAYNN